MALTSVLLLCTQQLLAAAARYYTNAQLCLELQQAVLTASSRVQVEVGESNYSSVVVDHGPPDAIMFITPRQSDGKVLMVNGKARWERMVCFYVEDIRGTKCFVWKEQALPGATPPVTVPPYPPVPAPWDKVATWKASPAPPHVVARNITDFQASDTSPLFLQLQSQDTTGNYQFTVVARVHPKN